MHLRNKSSNNGYFFLLDLIIELLESKKLAFGFFHFVLEIFILFHVHFFTGFFEELLGFFFMVLPQ